MAHWTKKGIILALCAAMVVGGAAAFPRFIYGSDISVNAAETYGDFEYSSNGTGATVTRYNGTEISVNIPEEINGLPVTGIGDNAFAGNSFLRYVRLPSGVENIGMRAFENCHGLLSINITQNVKRIGTEAFSGCNLLSSITVDSRNTVFVSVDGVLFDKNMNQLICYPASKNGSTYTVPNGVKYIGDSAFAHSVNLTTVEIPESVRSIGSDAFAYSASLTDIVIPEGITKINAATFFECEKLTDVKLPSTLKSIDNEAFENCTSLEKITIPDSVEEIGSSAFGHCSALTEITLPDSVMKLGKDAFTECIALKSAVLSGSIERICAGTFRNCISLKGIIIPECVVTIESDVFEGCVDLEYAVIPAAMTDIGNNAFRQCSEELTIYGVKGSYAEEYAKACNLHFGYSSIVRNYSTVTTTSTAGEPVILNAKAICGEGPYTYALMYRKKTSDKWVKIGKKYGESDTGSFTPKSAVPYEIMINVKDSTGKIKSKTFTVDIIAPLRNKTTISSGDVKAGEKVVLKGAASGGSKEYQYAFYYKKSGKKDWIEMKPAFTTKSASFRPGTATVYDVKSIVIDSEGRTAENQFTVNVTK